MVKKGSMNSLKTGAHINRSRLTIGELPKPLISVRREARSYRRLLESSVIAAHGEINLTRSHYIDTAAGATLHASVCKWVLKNRIEELSPVDITKCSSMIVKAKQDRDRAVERLKLDTPPKSPWETVET